MGRETHQQRTKKRRVLLAISLIVAGLLAGLLITEGLLRVIEVFWPGQLTLASDLEGRDQLIEDPKVGVRIQPNAAGHDANGFRNEAVPMQVDIIAIGDSQTWGNNANRDRAWPQTLARLSGHSTYNMGFGAYNPIEYLALLDEAMQLSPKIIVIGLYLGNDIWGAYSTVYLSERYPGLRDPQSSPELFIDTVIPQTESIYGEREEYSTWVQRSFLASWANKLREYSAVVNLLVRTMVTITGAEFKQGEAWAQSHPEKGAVYKNGKVRTVLEPAYRLLALDKNEPCIVEGLRITKDVLLSIQEQTFKDNIKLLVLIIPTKESVYADAVEASQGHISSTYAQMVEMETQIRNELIDFCDDSEIHYVDALPNLRDAVLLEEQIYPISADGHPVGKGYFYIASAVKDVLNKLEW